MSAHASGKPLTNKFLPNFMFCHVTVAICIEMHVELPIILPNHFLTVWSKPVNINNFNLVQVFGSTDGITPELTLLTWLLIVKLRQLQGI